MADFSKLHQQLTAQRAAKAEAVEQPPAKAKQPRAAAPPAPAPPPPGESERRAPGRKPSSASKRTGWKACTFYVQPETAVRLKRYVLQCQLEGRGVADQSEAVDAALRQWLDQMAASDA
jgi:hypothetical protein